MKSNNSSPALPVSQRIETLDILRGVALLGIFIMNMPIYNFSMFSGADGSDKWPGVVDRIAEATMGLLFSGKFNSMFSLLFGIGFTIQYGRLQARDPRRAGTIYLRRLLVLGCIGIIHALVFWTGDVLHVYALLGLVLLLFMRKIGQRGVFVAMLFCMAYPIFGGLVTLSLLTQDVLNEQIALAHAFEASNNLAYGQGNFADVVIENTRVMVHNYTNVWALWGASSWYVMMMLTMLLGFYVGRHRWAHRIPELLPQVRRIMWWALALGLLCGVAFTAIFQIDRTPVPSLLKVFGGFCYCTCRLAMMIFYVLLIVRLAEIPIWRRRLRFFAATGRMPLTNYLMQTLLATSLYYQWGFGLWGEVGPALGFVITFVLYFGVQVPLSRWWLTRHERGPMEWLWARLTYGNPSTS